MGGATANLLLADDPGPVTTSWRAIVHAMSTEVRGEDFWVAPSPDDGDRRTALPFLWLPHEPAAPLGALGDVDAEATLRERFGFTPGANLGLGAMCRGRASDRILARLAIELLTRHRGVLLFHGLLAPTLDGAGWREWYALPLEERARAFATSVAGHPGILAAVPCEGVLAYHAVDLAFLRYWYEHPAFHFVN